MCSDISDEVKGVCSDVSLNTRGVRDNDAVLWKREEKVGFDHKMLYSTGKN